MHSKKDRTEVGGDSAPLTDNPFGALGGLAAQLPAGPSPAPANVSKSEPPDRGPVFRVARTGKGGYPIFLEKRAAGKTVTVIRNISGDAEGLLRLLRKKCGAGGVVRDGEIELQGDHRAKVEALLKEG